MRTVVAIGVCAALFLPGSVGRAGGPPEIVVSSSDDELNEDGDCSLREAVAAANTNGPVDACQAGGPGIGGESDRIHVGPAEYRLSIPGSGEDQGATGDLDVTESVVLLGLRGGTTLIGAAGDRVLDVAPGITIVVSGLEIVGGDAGAEDGGGIRFRGDCGLGATRASVIGSVIRDSAAARGGGVSGGDCTDLGITDTSVVLNRATESGGGIASVGASRLTFMNVTVSTNAAGASGGGVWADLAGDPDDQTWDYSTIVRNAAPDGAGIWFRRDNSAILSNLIVAENDGPDCAGVQVSVFGHVSDDPSCNDPWIEVFPDPALGPLTTIQLDDPPPHGGAFAAIHPLLPASDAIDRSTPQQCPFDWIIDQIGAPRITDGDLDGRVWCDAGAVEAPAGTAPAPDIEPEPSPPPPAPQLPDTAVPVASGG